MGRVGWWALAIGAHGIHVVMEMEPIGRIRPSTVRTQSQRVRHALARIGIGTETIARYTTSLYRLLDSYSLLQYRLPFLSPLTLNSIHPPSSSQPSSDLHPVHPKASNATANGVSATTRRTHRVIYRLSSLPVTMNYDYSSQPHSNPSSVHSSPHSYPSSELDIDLDLDLYPNSFHPNINPFPLQHRRPHAKTSSYSTLQVTTAHPAPHEHDPSETTARPSNAHHHTQFHTQSLPLPTLSPSKPITPDQSTTSEPTTTHDPTHSAPDKDYTTTTPGLSRGLTRPLKPHEQELLAHLDRLKFFLATAPSRWDTSAAASATTPPNTSDPAGSSSSPYAPIPLAHPHTQTPPHPALNRFLLPTQEYVTCILWNGLYHITGTDIVRALVFRFEVRPLIESISKQIHLRTLPQAFGRPVRNLKKFEEGVFSDLRNLKPGVDACLEEPKVGTTTISSHFPLFVRRPLSSPIPR